MKVRDVMTEDVITADPGTPFDVIVDRMLFHDLTALPVVDAANHVVGIVTEADIVSKEAYGGRRRRLLDVVRDLLAGGASRWAVKGRGCVAKELMTPAPRTVAPDLDLRAAARLLVELHLKRFPVVDDDGRLVGVVSRRDVLQVLHRSDDDLAAEIVQILDDPFRAPEKHEVTARVQHGRVILEGSVLRPADRPVLDAVIWSVPGVVAIDDRTIAREPDPSPY